MPNPVETALGRIRANGNTLHISSTLSGRLVTTPRIHPETLRKLFAGRHIARQDGQYSWYRVRDTGTPGLQ